MEPEEPSQEATGASVELVGLVLRKEEKQGISPREPMSEARLVRRERGRVGLASRLRRSAWGGLRCYSPRARRV